MYRKRLFFLILITSVIRLLLAKILELGNDEVYYFTYPAHLQSNYFDHPPGIAFLIRLFTFNLHFTDELFVRLGAICCAGLGTWLAFKIGSFIRSERTGWIAAVMYATSIYCSIIAGTFILPDSPQIIFWLYALYLLLVIINKLETGNKASVAHWILFGIVNGICIMCKVHGVFIWGGLGLYVLFYKRSMFSLPAMYLSFFITLLIISPVFLWNLSNNFVTYNYHSARVGVNHFHLDTDSLLQTFLGQWFYNSPINVVVIMIGVTAAFRKRLLEKYYVRILLLCGLPIVLTVTVMSMFNPVLPHWSGPGFLTLSFIGAAYLDGIRIKKMSHHTPVILKWMVGFMLVLLIGGVSVIKYYPGTIGNKQNDRLGENDFTLDMYGWKSFGNSFQNWYNKEVDLNLLPGGLHIVCDKWFPAAHIDYYVAPLISSYVIGIGDINDLHHYKWLNDYRGNIREGDNVLCIEPSNYPVDVSKTFQKYFSSIKKVGKFIQTRNGKVCRYFTIYYFKKYKRSDNQPS